MVDLLFNELDSDAALGNWFLRSSYYGCFNVEELAVANLKSGSKSDRQ